MKRYTIRGLIHDAKVFNQLRLEHRETRKKQRKYGLLIGCTVYSAGKRRRARA
jgi:hypothetical protein